MDYFLLIFTQMTKNLLKDYQKKDLTKQLIQKG
jgi:hypothetical protein